MQKSETKFVLLIALGILITGTVASSNLGRSGGLAFLLGATSSNVADGINWAVGGGAGLLLCRAHLGFARLAICVVLGLIIGSRINSGLAYVGAHTAHANSRWLTFTCAATLAAILSCELVAWITRRVVTASPKS